MTIWNKQETKKSSYVYKNEKYKRREKYEKRSKYVKMFHIKTKKLDIQKWESKRRNEWMEWKKILSDENVKKVVACNSTLMGQFGEANKRQL